MDYEKLQKASYLASKIECLKNFKESLMNEKKEKILYVIGNQSSYEYVLEEDIRQILIVGIEAKLQRFEKEFEDL